MDSNSDKTDSDSSSKNGFEFKQRIRIRIRTGFEFRNGFIQLQFCCVVAVSRAYRGSVCKGCGVALHETGAGLFRSKNQIFFQNFSSIFFHFFIIFFKKNQNKISRYRAPGTVFPGTVTRAVRFRRQIPKLSSRGDFESNLTCFTLDPVSIEFLSFLRTGIACYMNSTGHNRSRISKALKDGRCRAEIRVQTKSIRYRECQTVFMENQ